MEVWQILLMAFFVLVPFALLLDYHPGRERLNASGHPLERDWAPEVSHPDPDDEHH